MATTGSGVQLSDSQLAVEMLKRRLVNESQLKAAIDYQESLGGRLVEILVKLRLVRQDALDSFLAQLAAGADGKTEELSRTGDRVLVDPRKLKVHRKLLEKVPAELAKAHNLLFFFPPPGTRAILVSAEGDAPPDLLSRLESLLGVEMRRFELSPADHAACLADLERQRQGKAPPSPDCRPRQSANERSNDHQILRALVNLLDRKELVSREELQVELELLRRREGS